MSHGGAEVGPIGQGTQGNSIMMRLREATAQLHDDAEHAEFQKHLSAGTLPLSTFVLSITQLYWLHRTLDGLLRAHAATESEIGAVIDADFYMEEQLARDLRHFGLDAGSTEQTAVTREFCAKMRESAEKCRLSLLGFAYVFAGSMNGNRFLARVVKQAYRLNDGAGAEYFDPYGERQRAVWEGFKARMNALTLSSEDANAIVEAGKSCFQGVIAMYADVYRSSRQAQAKASV